MPRNTAAFRKLYETAHAQGGFFTARHCPHVYHVQTYADLRPGWFVNARTIGITAGTSTPDEIIDEVDRRIRAFAEAVSGREAVTDR